MIRASRLRWNVTVGGDQLLPRRKGALIVVNARTLALAPVFAALARCEIVDRPVRFVGRPDTAPVGAFMRRIGGLLDHPDEVAGALAAVFPAATSSSPIGRARSVKMGDIRTGTPLDWLPLSGLGGA